MNIEELRGARTRVVARWTILGACALFPWLTHAAAPVPRPMTQSQVRAVESLPALEAVETDSRGIPTRLRADLGVLRAEPMVRAADTATLLRTLRGVLRADGTEQLRVRRENHDFRRGERHYRMQQLINGREVIGGEMIVHVSDAGSRVKSIDAQFLPASGLPTAASVAAEEAMRGGLAQIGAISPTRLSVPRLVYVRMPDARGHLVWAAYVDYTDARGHRQLDEILVDATSGRFVQRLPQVHSALNREIRDWATDAVIVTEGNTTTDTAAANVYTFSGDTYNYFSSTFGRDSWNGGGAQMLAYVHGSFWGANNAVFFCGFGYAEFGDGDGVNYGSFAARDIVAHEWGHGVVCSDAALGLTGPPGALNESFADIFGAAVEASVTGVTANTWLIGEGVATPGVPGDAERYMGNPALDGHSRDYYPDYLPTDDEHYGSGIGNLAFYLLANGGSHPQGKTATVVTGIGIAKAARIFYLTLRDRLLSNDGYPALRAKSIETAIAEYGSNSAEHLSTVSAWTAVGVPAAPNPPTVSATSWSYTRVRNRPPTISGPITVTASGGSPPYTYAWQRVSGNTTIHASSPTSATTSFQKAIVNGGWWTSVWRCQVTDNAGQIVYSPNVTVTFEWDTGQ